MPFLSLVEFAESDNVWMIEHFKNLSFFQGLLFLSLTHVGDVDLLDNAEVPIAFTLDQVGFTKGTLTEQLLFLVHFKKGCRRIVCLVICALHILNY